MYKPELACYTPTGGIHRAKYVSLFHLFNFLLISVQLFSIIVCSGLLKIVASNLTSATDFFVVSSARRIVENGEFWYSIKSKRKLKAMFLLQFELYFELPSQSHVVCMVFRSFGSTSWSNPVCCHALHLRSVALRPNSTFCALSPAVTRCTSVSVTLWVPWEGFLDSTVSRSSMCLIYM